jgi:hypothetical protein
MRLGRPVFPCGAARTPAIGARGLSNGAISRVGGRHEKTALLRGSGGGGPTRTRTVDQRIMSCLETLQAQ